MYQNQLIDALNLECRSGSLASLTADERQIFPLSPVALNHWMVQKSNGTEENEKKVVECLEPASHLAGMPDTKDKDFFHGLGLFSSS